MSEDGRPTGVAVAADIDSMGKDVLQVELRDEVEGGEPRVTLALTPMHRTIDVVTAGMEAEAAHRLAQMLDLVAELAEQRAASIEADGEEDDDV